MQAKQHFGSTTSSPRSILKSIGHSSFIHNKGALDISKHVTQHGKMHHFKLDSFWLREVVKEEELVLKLIPSGTNLADIFTKVVVRDQFIHMREMLEMLRESQARGSVGR